MDNNSAWKVAFSTSAVAFGIHVGGGFATGNQTVQYFIRFGWTGILFPILAVILMNIVFREAFICALKNDAQNYRDWADKAFAPFGSIMGIVFEVAFIIITLIATATSIAGAGSVLQTYGVPYNVGIWFTTFVFFICIIWGRSVIAKVGSVMTIIIVLCSLIVYASALTAPGSNLGAALSTSNQTGGFGAAILAMLYYVGFQSYTGANMAAFQKDLKSVETINKFFIINTVLNAVMLGLSSIVLLAWSGTVSGTTVPILEITNHIGGGSFLHLMYAVALCLAFVSTGVGCVFTFVTRFENKFPETMSPTVRRAISAVIGLGLSTGMSTFGLTALVAKGYGYLGKIGIFIMILPCITFIMMRNKKGVTAAEINAKK